jgi:Carboxypeptidase regulatory-like domain
MKLHRVALWIVPVILTLSLAAWAQDTASITGTVTDPSGAAVAGAQVTLTNLEHGIKRSGTSNGSGDYLFASLPIGSYDLTVAAQGFKKYEAKGIILRVADKARVNVPLQVGAISTEVIVQGTEVAQVETQSSDLGGAVTGKEITQLELNGRNFTQLITLVPGVTNQSGQDEAQVGVNGNVAFSVNGGRTEYNNWEMDGGDALDNGSNTSLNVYPSVDAIAEFKVETSNYGAQYGRNGSGTVEIETKSGTSHFHGDVYEFVRNDMFNATQYFLPNVPSYKKNDYGFTIGGPIYIPGHYNKDKQRTFFFWSEEWRREIVPSGFSVTTVPSMAERGGNFSDLCPSAGTQFQRQTTPTSQNMAAPLFADCPGTAAGVNDKDGDPLYNTYANNQVPYNSADPTVAALENLIPAPNVGANQWLQSPSLPTHWREELFKIDHNFTDKVRGSFRYIHDSWAQIYPTPLWTAGTSFPTVETNFVGPGVSMVARLTASASPTLLNEFVASYTTDHITLNLVGPNWQRPSGVTLGVFQNGFGGKVPGISLNGGVYNGINQDPGYIPNGPLNSNPTYTYKDNVTKIIGKHNLQFGGYFVAAQKNEIPQPGVSTNGILSYSTSDAAVTSGNAFADLLLGSVQQFQQEESAIKTYNRYKIFEPYFQDDFHATSRLTLNLGLRVSMFGTYREIHHNAWNFDPAHYIPGASFTDANDFVGGTIPNPQFNGWVQCGVTPGVQAGCMKGHLFNPAPRIGFAFDPKGDGKWAIRGGYGIFFEHTNQGEANAGTLEQYNPLTQTATVSNITGYANVNPSALGATTTPLTFVSIPNKAIWPYIQQWHFDLEHDLGKNTVATVSYVGSAGVHLTRQFELNELQPVPAAQNPYVSGEPMSPNDCGTSLDAYGIPMNGMTSDGATIPYHVGSNGVPFGPAVNVGVAECGAVADPFRPYNGIGSITRKEDTASSNYHALEVAVRHSVGGLQLNLAYTYSHSIDNSSDYGDVGAFNSYNLNSFRASSNFDQRHVFNVGYVYDLPFFKGSGLTHKLLGGWQWSGITVIQTGTPFSIYNAGGSGVPGDNAGVGSGVATSGSSWPDVVGNPKVGIPPTLAGNGLGPFYFNPSVFVAPQGLTFGDAGRNILNNPVRTNFDMALLKHFAVTESRYFEFRAEAFNIFNHTEYSWLGGDAGSAANNAGLGTASSSIGCYGGANNNAGDSSCIFPGSGVAFGQATAAHLPRILQFALKFIF